jgi:hypothetical protein
MFLKKAPKLLWTHHAREKMAYYRLSEQRVRRVLNAPKRIEEGVAPKTVAAMAPVSTHGTSTNINRNPLFRRSSLSRKSGADEKWSQEIWVMVQDVPTGRKIISAWRYPGVSKVRGEISSIMENEYKSYLKKN